MTTPPQLDEVLDSVYFAANNSLYVVGEVRTGTSTSYYATIKYSYGGSSGSPNDVKWTYYPSSSGSGNRRGVAIAASVVYVPTDDSEGPPTSEPRPTIFVTGIVPGGDESGNDTDVSLPTAGGHGCNVTSGPPRTLRG